MRKESWTVARPLRKVLGTESMFIICQARRERGLWPASGFAGRGHGYSGHAIREGLLPYGHQAQGAGGQWASHLTPVSHLPSADPCRAVLGGLEPSATSSLLF